MRERERENKKVRKTCFPAGIELDWVGESRAQTFQKLPFAFRITFPNSLKYTSEFTS